MDDRARLVGSLDPLVLGGLLDQAVNSLRLGIILFNGNREVVYCNRRYADMYGLSPEQVQAGTPVSDLIEHRLKLGLKIRGEADAYIRSRTEGMVVSERTVQEFADGRIIAYTVLPLPDGGGMATHEDITEREELSARLQQRNMQFDIAINNMPHGLCFFDASHRLIVCNRDFIDMYGLPPERVRPGTPLSDIVDMRFEAGSVPAMTRDEYMKWRTGVVVSAEPVDSIIEMRNGRTFKVRHRPMPDLGWVATHEDITEQRQAELRIAYMAHHDALTDLGNRTLLNQRLAQAFASGQAFAVHHIDLDKFKSVNDTLGHHAGDALLKGVAERLRRLARPGDTIARMGGDEFVVLQTPIEGADEARVLAQRIIVQMAAPFEIDDGQTIAGASIGIAIAPADGATSEQLLRNADLALYRAKSDGRGTYRLFEPAMDEQVQNRRALELDLRKALVGGEFELHYQPLVRSQNGEISGFEALIRWRHPQHGLMAPGSFIPLAEEIGLIVPIGEWVIRQACRTASRWPKHLHVAVNISAVQFRYAGLAEVIVGALAAAGLEANRLEIEITESVLLQDKEGTLAILHRLRELGVRIAMDDFGTGYSSLTYLQCFPFDKIKIDRSFVRDVATDAGSLNIVRAITALANGMGMTATAEGVETREQLDRVAAEGCSEMQGYLFSRPLPADEIERRFLSADIPVLRDRFAAA
ncbi:putative bifunctional diguanylate cyclase/phosphodiesterase [Bradyrhizobium sp. GCM10027634]|uniref:putative bifunctional diguanylate cyclase/phosphodiesterase n=1 Tax=unclassified Bradyrhizobium TaxID=2631580 RepID=UPI00188C538E|nr:MULTISPECIES: EAL domain-containing protein [unclassified Bradyrhizobium]MDN5000306.1 EAL domain-containing protein [Bradyrhizobium sp. WYCCWR 12677]QOZ42928.1 bifunctional diguanylate cyclase/phosphodiesterase [Bradyrhizobium sp. CCBAU 53340]